MGERGRRHTSLLCRGSSVRALPAWDLFIIRVPSLWSMGARAPPASDRSPPAARRPPPAARPNTDEGLGVRVQGFVRRGGAQARGAYGQVLATGLPGFALSPASTGRPLGLPASAGGLAADYNWFAEPFADSERVAIL